MVQIVASHTRYSKGMLVNSLRHSKSDGWWLFLGPSIGVVMVMGRNCRVATPQIPYVGVFVWAHGQAGLVKK
jgi:hypothetical protein